jgi:hypothetical protein
MAAEAKPAKAPKLNPDGTPKVRKKPAPRKQFAIYKLGTDEAGQPVLSSLEFTRNPMALVEALQRGDGSKFMQVELKK